MTIPTPATTPHPDAPLTDAQMIAAERQHLVEYLREAGPNAPTLCEGWLTRHLIAHLILRESKPLIAAGVLGGPLAKRTEQETDDFAGTLLTVGAYDTALFDFSKLPGYLHMRSHRPSADVAMNLIEYFVHTEDVRRVKEHWEPRDLPLEVQQKIWELLCKRARLMAGKKYKSGLVLEAPGCFPVSHTVFKPKASARPVTLSGDPGELALYLFGREQAVVTVS